MRGDDGFGWHAAERLRERVADPEIEVLTLHQLTPELMETVSGAGRVIFLDAAAQGTPGEVFRREIGGSEAARVLTHHMSPEGLLAGARVLYGAAPPAVMYSVAGEDFGLRESLSAPVLHALEAVVAEILNNL